MKLFRRKTARGALLEETDILSEPSVEHGGPAPDTDETGFEELLDMLPEDDAHRSAEPGFTSAGRLAGHVASLPRRRRIWDLEADSLDTMQPREPRETEPEVKVEEAASSAPAASPDDVALARAQIAQFSEGGLAPGMQPIVGGRAKTRLLGFQSATLAAQDPFADTASGNACASQRYPVGWIVVSDGPGRGACFTLTAGVSSIGRGNDQTISLDFGDNSISRQNHASIAYDAEANRFYLGQGGKSNIVRLNGRPVLSTEDLSDEDTIRIGETELRFVAFCGARFDWMTCGSRDEGPHVAAE